MNKENKDLTEISSLALSLKENGFSGRIYSDSLSKRVYSVDASIYQIEPQLICVAQVEGDIDIAVQLCSQTGVSLTVRGAATGIAGGCINKGLILDVSKLNKILEINYEEGYAIVQPGVVQDQLNAILKPEGFCLGPDTSTGNRATIGGMVANNSAGAHSIRYGKMIDHTLAVDIVLSDGSSRCLEKNMNWKESPLLNQAKKLYESCREKKKLILEKIPQIHRRVSGYNIDEMALAETWDELDWPRIFTGSEGTLGVAKKIKIKISPWPKVRVLAVLHFKDFAQGLNLSEFINGFKPFALELMDGHLVSLGKESTMMRGELDWLEGEPDLLLCVEFDGATQDEAESKMHSFREAFDVKTKDCYTFNILVSASDQAKVWKLRKAGLGLLMSERTQGKAVAFLEDVAVAPDKLASFMEEFRKYITDSGKRAGFYGHAGAGCLHVRPILDLRDQGDQEYLVKAMKDVSQMLKKYGGSLSGEHGDGIVRSWLHEDFFGEEVYSLMCELKDIFDPKNLLNPGKIVRSYPALENLREVKNSSVPDESQLFYDYGEGGFAKNLDMCNGNGECRRFDGGVMCPSFRADGDEFKSTRARAQALQGAFLSEQENWQESEELHNILDLCLECKGCKAQCPSSIDMAKYKSEHLYQRHQRLGVPKRAKFFANVAKMNEKARRFRPVVNALTNNKFFRRFLEKSYGIARQRKLPMLQKESPSHQAQKYPWAQPKEPVAKVAVFVDTFSEFNESAPLEALKNILLNANCEVRYFRPSCCGRPMISQGLLAEARESAERVVDSILQLKEEGFLVTAVEPGCYYTLWDEYPDLVENRGRALEAKSTLRSWEDLLLDVLPKVKKSSEQGSKKIYFHGHCHQKSLEGTGKMLEVLRHSGEEIIEVSSSCCGMAGSFGYETEHYEFSVQVAEKTILPQLKNLEKGSVLLSPGMSCRSQIEHLSEIKVQHPLVYLEQNLNI